MNTSSVEAAGKPFNQKNVARLKQSWQLLTDALVESGDLSFGDFPKELITAQNVYDSQISASARLSEIVTAEAWRQTLNTVTEYFKYMFSDIASCRDKSEAEKDARISELTSDFLAIVRDLAKNAPTDPRSYERVYASEQTAQVSQTEGTAALVPPEPERSSQTELKTEPVAETTVEATPENKPISDLERLFEGLPNADEQTLVQEQEVQASEQDLSFSLLEDGKLILQIEARAKVELSATNERIVNGTLFQTDRASEAIPSVGPGLPLFIPRKVAEEALACLDFGRPKPIDAHDTLAQHASTEIVGAMTAARIEGNDFLVSGVLWDHNQPEKVKAIFASQDHLGMSVNGTAEGHHTEIDGRSVWQIDKLRILGANILYSEKATFKKTRTNVLASSESGDLIPVLASADDFEPVNTVNSPETMDTKDILDQIAKLSDSVAAMHKENTNRLATIEPKVEALSAQMGAIQAAAQEARNQELQAAAVQAEQEKQAQLIETLTKTLDERLAPLTATPKSGSKYPSKPLPLAASGAAPTAAPNSLQIQLAALEGEIKGLMKNPNYDLQTAIELKDKKRDLELQLGNRSE
jgi:hypothetical protein